MKNIHIENSYNVWSINHMFAEIVHQCHMKYNTMDVESIMNRSLRGMYIEWYLHNIGYWITYFFTEFDWVENLNKRFRHVDLEEHKR